MLDDKYGALVEAHFTALRVEYPDLTLSLTDDGATVSGALQFDAVFNGVRLADAYHIEIQLPDDYPDRPPTAKETGGRISDDFHKNDGGQLCLAAPLEVIKQFNRQPDLYGFVKHLIVPYLYTYSHKLKYNFLPYGELSHGEDGLSESCQGLLEAYKTKMGVANVLDVMRLLKVLAENNYRGHLPCPCGSNEKLRRCHGPIILELKEENTPAYYFEEYFTLLFHLFPEVRETPRELLSKKLLDGLRKL